jgi:hypothetical protein
MARSCPGCLLLATLTLIPLGTGALTRAADHPGDPGAAAGMIDQLVAARWAAAKAQPALPASDAEFLRRVYLDLNGKIPSVSAARAFLEDAAPDKRRRLVERLLRSPGYVTHFSHVWRDILLPNNSMDGNNLAFRADFEAWLRARLSANTGYDQMVREILTAAVGPRRGQALAFLELPTAGRATPLAFYLANENKPENLAGSTARVFLAVKLECAQCHNHPFARWSQEQFWQYAGFFTGVAGGKAPQIKIPSTDEVVEARFLDGTKPKWTNGVDPRVTLAEWMLRPDNPYFARAAVNRLWGYFFGSGLVEPVDDLTRETEKNVVLDELARQFAGHQYDLKFLVRAIVTSRAYGLSSIATHPSQDDPRLFALMAVKGLAPEQIFDSLVEATRYERPVGAPAPEFLAQFGTQSGKRTDYQTSILQALALMNGKVVADATSLEHSATLAGVADAPFLDTGGRIEALYLASFSRLPRADEIALLVKYVDQGGPSGDRQQALADVFWALLNSGEFLFNH